MIKISKIFGDFVPRDSSLCQSLLPSIRHFENRRGEGPGDEVGSVTYLDFLHARIIHDGTSNIKVVEFSASHKTRFFFNILNSTG